MNISSSLYRELTPDELNRVLQSLLHTAPVSARLLSGGLFNTTYLVHTADCGDVVLRVGPVNRHLIMPFERRLMAHESAVYALCNEHSIPASELLAVDTSKTVIDRDLMAVRYIPSVSIRDESIPEPDRARLMQEFGRHVAGLHTITVPRFGHVADVQNGGGFQKWSDFLKAELRDWESVAVPAGLFTPAEHSRLRKIYDDHTDLLDEITTPVLVHADLGWNNVLVRTDTPDPAFGALIDADRAMFADPEFEFCQIDWMLTPDFLAGYGHRPSNPTRRMLCRLTRLLCDAYVWEVEYNMHDNMLATRNVILQLMDVL